MTVLAGQTVVVIGGSSGIGLATARRARAEGASVIGPYYAPVAELDFAKVREDVESQLLLPLRIGQLAIGKVRGTLLSSSGRRFPSAGWSGRRMSPRWPFT